MRAALHTVVLLLAACAVDLPDEPGLRCDDEHPCSEGRDCVGGICVDEGGAGGGLAQGGGAGGGGSTGGGTAGTGGGGAGGGTAGGMSNAGGGTGGTGGSGGGTPMPVDAGSVVWRQEIDGFTSNGAPGSATVTVRADAGNQVISTIVTAADGNDVATAVYADAGRLPQSGHGRLRGRFRFPSTLNLRGNSTFVRLENGSNVVISMSFNASEQLVVRSDTGFISNTALTQTIARAGGYTPNTDYTVDVAWQRGQYLSVSINGLDAGMLGATMPTTGLITPRQLELGINGYEGDAGTGWSVTLTDWALADGPTVPL